MGYKYLLSAPHTVTDFLVCRHGVGGRGGGDENDLHHHGPNPNEGGGVEQRREEEEVGDRGGIEWR